MLHKFLKLYTHYVVLACFKVSLTIFKAKFG